MNRQNESPIPPRAEPATAAPAAAAGGPQQHHRQQQQQQQGGSSTSSASMKFSMIPPLPGSVDSKENGSSRRRQRGGGNISNNNKTRPAGAGLVGESSSSKIPRFPSIAAAAEQQHQHRPPSAIKLMPTNQQQQQSTPSRSAAAAVASSDTLDSPHQQQHQQPKRQPLSQRTTSKGSVDAFLPVGSSSSMAFSSAASPAALQSLSQGSHSSNSNNTSASRLAGTGGGSGGGAGVLRYGESMEALFGVTSASSEEYRRLCSTLAYGNGGAATSSQQDAAATTWRRVLELASSSTSSQSSSTTVDLLRLHRRATSRLSSLQSASLTSSQQSSTNNNSNNNEEDVVAIWLSYAKAQLARGLGEEARLTLKHVQNQVGGGAGGQQQQQQHKGVAQLLAELERVQQQQQSTKQPGSNPNNSNNSTIDDPAPVPAKRSLPEQQEAATATTASSSSSKRLRTDLNMFRQTSPAALQPVAEADSDPGGTEQPKQQQQPHVPSAPPVKGETSTNNRTKVGMQEASSSNVAPAVPSDANNSNSGSRTEVAPAASAVRKPFATIAPPPPLATSAAVEETKEEQRGIPSPNSAITESKEKSTDTKSNATPSVNDSSSLGVKNECIPSSESKAKAAEADNLLVSKEPKSEQSKKLTSSGLTPRRPAYPLLATTRAGSLSGTKSSSRRPPLLSKNTGRLARAGKLGMPQRVDPSNTSILADSDSDDEDEDDHGGEDNNKESASKRSASGRIADPAQQDTKKKAALKITKTDLRYMFEWDPDKLKLQDKQASSSASLSGNNDDSDQNPTSPLDTLVEEDDAPSVTFTMNGAGSDAAPSHHSGPKEELKGSSPPSAEETDGQQKHPRLDDEEDKTEKRNSASSRDTRPATSSQSQPTEVADTTTSSNAVRKLRKEANVAFLPLVKESNMLQVNGVPYAKLGVIGKGGSCKVYRALSKNCSIVAIKKVKLSGMNTKAISGYANEIALLKRLRGNPAIIQMFDSEVDLERKALFVVMELGEVDLSQVLQQQSLATGGRSSSSGQRRNLNMNFIRMTWQQMLGAVHSIHEARIVHADLKPANFLFVRGALKLIDFGIAKAIQSDDTTNIYRESQIGTLNYMSPEAINDSGTGLNGPRMKIGRASDIWSLGCILYQMVYGSTPFAELLMFPKLRAIVNPDHDIDFPDGGDEGAVDAMKQCLRRNANERPPIVGPGGLLNEHKFLNSRKPPPTST